MTNDLPIYLAKDNIQRSDDRHDVSDHLSFRHHWQRGEIHETRTTEVNATRLWSTIRLHVNTQPSLRRLNWLINFARRNIETFSHDQEVVNESIHVTLHRFTIRQHNLRRLGLHWTRLQTRERLHRDLVRLIHLSHAHHVARPNVTLRFCRNFEVV